MTATSRSSGYRGGLPLLEPPVSDADRERAVALLENPVALEASNTYIAVRSGHWPREPLWFVPTEADAVRLMQDEGLERGVVWTALELMILRLRHTTRDRIRQVVAAKAAFGGTVEEAL